MKYYLALIILLSFSAIASASGENTFEGTYTIEFKSEKGKTTNLLVSVKDSMVVIKNIQGGHSKYSSYILNLNTNRLITVSKAEKKVAITYPLNKLLSMYEKENLKDGYKVYSDIISKPTDKIKEEYGIKMTKYIGESSTHKSTFWLADTGFDFNQLIPLLRLIGCWNEAQLNKGTIIEAEVTGKVSKKTSTVVVVFRREFLSDSIFEVPKSYLQKDFVKLMEEEKNNKDLKVIVQTFAGF